MMSIATDEAVQMLMSGWTVKKRVNYDVIAWRSPDGISSSDFESESLDDPPIAAVKFAKQRGDIKPIFRVP